MSINKFVTKYKTSSKTSIDKICNKWRAEKVASDFLGTEIMAGVLIGDAIIGGDILDHLSLNVKMAFSELMKGKADSITEIKSLIIEKYQISPKSVEGLLNKVQGQYGENIFVISVGSTASLAESGSQKGWDVKIEHSEGPQFVQVKVYKNPNEVVEHIQKVNRNAINGDYGEVTEIDFAVNSDIFEAVQQKSEELGLPNKIINLGATRDEIRGSLENGFETLKEITVFDNFFSEVLSSALSASAIHVAANAFLLWKGTKEKEAAIEDVIYSTGVSAGGIAASMGTRAVIGEIAALTELEIVGAMFGPVGLVAALGAGYGTREVLKRIALRKETSNQLLKDLNYNKKLISRIEAPLKKAI